MSRIPFNSNKTRTIIAGGRDFENYDVLCSFLKENSIFPTLIISGNAKGADSLGERYARENNIPLQLFPAEWEKYGRKAGYIRNKEMSLHAESLVAFWDGKSKGTKSMIDIAIKKGMAVYVHKYTKNK